MFNVHVYTCTCIIHVRLHVGGAVLFLVLGFHVCSEGTCMYMYIIVYTLYVYVGSSHMHVHMYM